MTASRVAACRISPVAIPASTDLSASSSLEEPAELGRRSGGIMGEVDRDFEELFDAEFPAVVRSAFVVCQELSRAEDVAQEAFVELLRHWGRVSRYERPGAWVRRVAIRKAVQVTKRE